MEEIFSLVGVDNDTSRKREVSRDAEKSRAYSVGTISCCTLLGMIKNIINEMIKQYAFLLAQKLALSSETRVDGDAVVSNTNSRPKLK